MRRYYERAGDYGKTANVLDEGIDPIKMVERGIELPTNSTVNTITRPNDIVNTQSSAMRNSIDINGGRKSIFRGGEILDTDPAILNQAVNELDTSSYTKPQMTAFNKFKQNVGRIASAQSTIDVLSGRNLTAAENIAESRRLLLGDGERSISNHERVGYAPENQDIFRVASYKTGRRLIELKPYGSNESSRENRGREDGSSLKHSRVYQDFEVEATEGRSAPTIDIDGISIVLLRFLLTFFSSLCYPFGIGGHRSLICRHAPER